MKFTPVLLSMLVGAYAAPSVITDMAIRSELQERQDQALELIRNGTVVPIEISARESLEKRQGGIAGIFVQAGLYLITKAGGKITTKASTELAKSLSDENDLIWGNSNYCRIWTATKAGANCDVRSMRRGFANSDAAGYGDHNWDDCAWINPGPGTEPPIVFYEDEGFGRYSVRYTATDRYAWDGIHDSVKCNQEGLCHPQFIFYREGYDIVLNSWQSQGRISACQYSAGGDCGGLCDIARKNGDNGGGAWMAGDCAVPCIDDANLPEAEAVEWFGIPVGK